ncbi:MAG: hypothetical protein DRH49_00965 [Candidatus Coatesbacteria bacterium]|nr:MAG: hypothetical protein DRH49_00965 [Candidatus Coatesbacteria bacterium]
MRRFIFLSIILLLAGIALSDGGIIPIEPPYWSLPVPPKLSIGEHIVDVEIDGELAYTTVDEVFINDNDVVLEGDYIFPLPEDAAVSEFYMYVDGKKISAEIMDADEAERLYQEYIRKKIDPALLSFYGRGLFRARVSDIPAHGKKRVQLKYSEIVKKEGSLNCYVYPLNIDDFTEKPIKNLDIKINLKADRDIVNVFSPSHKITVNMKSTREYEVVLKQEDVKPDKDLYLYYELTEEGYGLSLVTHKEPQEDGFFLLLMTPSVGKEGLDQAREIVFVVDKSGSMRGEKIEQVKKALSYCVEHLNLIDRFNVISFSSEVAMLFDEPVSANEDNKAKALEYIDSIEARGGTNINEALIKSLEQFDSNSNAVRMLIFLTDGKPTIGTVDEATILDNIAKANESVIGYIFGVGYDLNAFLLDRISETLHGMTEYIAPYENIDDAVVRFYDAISKPALVDARLDFGEIEVYDVQPAKLGSIFAGQQIVVMGRYKGEGITSIYLTGLIEGVESTYTFTADFKKSKHPYIPVLWATRQVAYYLDEIRLHGENEELVEEIKYLAQRYGIVTPYTSMFISEITGTEPRTIIYRPLGAEEARAMDSIGFSGGAPTFSEKAMRESELGVSIAEDIAKMKKGYSGYETKVVKKVEDVAFYLKDKVWVDSRYKEGMEKKKVEYGSDAYFGLMGRDEKLARLLSVGRNAIIVWEGVAYEIVEKS